MERSDMSSSRNYESLYGVGLLDDLHNYFPALLYDSSSFSNVQQILNYVQAQTRSRFDLFSLGQREYASSLPPVVLPVRPSHRSADSSVGSSSVPQERNQASGLPTAAGTASTLPVRLAPNHFQEAARQILEEEVPPSVTQDITSRLLLELLRMPPSPPPVRRPTTTLTSLFTIPLTNTNLEAFLEPVIVRPTPEQIAQFTTVANLASDTDHTCSICEDTIQPDEEARKLNVCGHWFHRNCIDEWFGRSVLCPNCRHDIREPAAVSANTRVRSRQNSVASPPNP